MKKILQLFSLVSFVFILSVISANAQSDYGSEVLIPFEFSVGGRSYEPGKYVFKLSRLKSGGATVMVRDLEQGRVQIVFAKLNGDSAVADVNLIFDNVDGVRTLSRIVTPAGGYALKKGERPREIAARAKSRTESVIVTDLF